MLYPLSYEGLRPISYRPGETHECPGVPWDANLCHWVCWRRFRRWSEDTPSKFRAHGAGCARGCPALISGVIHSPSTSGALATPSELGKHLREST